MKSQRSIKVIFDTNIWISFLIGKKLSSLKEKIASGQVILVISDQLLAELQLVAKRPAFQKYFEKHKAEELLTFMKIIGINYKCKSKHLFKNDLKDSFLLNLIEASKADYLITGDSELIKLNSFLTAEILSPSDFEKDVLF